MHVDAHTPAISVFEFHRRCPPRKSALRLDQRRYPGCDVAVLVASRGDALLVKAQHQRLLLGSGFHLLTRKSSQFRVLLLDPLGESEATRIEHVLGLGDREHDAQHGLGKAALFLARLVSRSKSAETAFAAMFLALALSTIGATAGLFALDYRTYYAEWHEDFGTITWAFQFFFTTANAVVQFAVLGTGLFFPLGFVGLFAASLWFARSTR